MTVTYRDATVEDASAIARFAAYNFVATFGHLYPPEDLAAFLAGKYAPSVQVRELADAGTRYRLAFEGGTLVGYCMMGALDIDVTEVGAVELHRLYVDPAHKGAGVAAALMDDMIGWASLRAAPAIYLSVWEDNGRAQAFYRRYGFEHVGEHKFMVGRTADRDFIWRRALDRR